MKFFETLFEMLESRRGAARRGGAAPRPSRPGPVPAARAKPVEKRGGAARPSMQERYDALVAEMKRVHGFRVRKWRRGTSGVAWILQYEDGTTRRLIESPYPRGPISCAVFLHEVGHHAIGLGVHRPRCLEEHLAWEWSLATMRARGFSVTPAVERRVEEAMRYAVVKALRRGLKRLPAELVRYAPPEVAATAIRQARRGAATRQG